MALPTHVGGSFAPPLDSAKLKTYAALAEAAPPQIREAMDALAQAVGQYHQQAPSKRKGTPHPSGMGTVVPLDAETVEALWDAVPWEEELEMYGKLFDRIDPKADKPLRDAAFHLLWFGRELNLDRTPLTTDTL